jgi:hypothetical protein
MKLGDIFSFKEKKNERLIDFNSTCPHVQIGHLRLYIGAEEKCQVGKSTKKRSAEKIRNTLSCFFFTFFCSIWFYNTRVSRCTRGELLASDFFFAVTIHDAVRLRAVYISEGVSALPLRLLGSGGRLSLLL